MYTDVSYTDVLYTDVLYTDVCLLVELYIKLNVETLASYMPVSILKSSNIGSPASSTSPSS